MKQYLLLISGVCMVLLYNQCTNNSGLVRVEIDESPFEKLSEYQFFVGALANLEPNEGVVPYDLNTPLFSDYAHKARFVWMPKGTSANYQIGTVVDFPKGAVLIKHFYYENDETNPNTTKKIIETRLLIHRKTGWDAHTYLWNEEQTEANYDVSGGVKKVTWTNKKGIEQSVNYIIPNKNQCKGCHSYKQELMPIGPKVRNLNRNFVYSDGKFNQLEKWSSIGYLLGFDPVVTHPKVAKWDDPNSGSLHDRALGYLDINCGHCHNLHGPGGTTGLNLVYGNPLDLNLGIHKPPVASGRASGGFSSSIVPNQPDISIMTHRMASEEVGVMMPELGRTTTHKEGLELIREWIEKMEI